MSSRTATLSATLAATVLLAGSVALAAPASAAPTGPAVQSRVSDSASCVGKVFVPQALDDPGTVARRIAEIKGFIDVPFGTPISGLARTTDC
ncbi:hypothetical protein G7072_08380 [Nocardioides sp. HDW12B]|uniref:hypothetical protein n=1 Tax=Nocardioides sp. HDW12B TaxID=2714939 RepID=UPI001409589D|nr:hypothetical protein [Nocardioides sp. HDW12B]QIK66373.1 hypothetical protein G7072_08380 [Nocardioides sp. HDW12B]